MGVPNTPCEPQKLADDLMHLKYDMLTNTSTDNAIVKFDGEYGKLQNSLAVINEDGNIITPAGALSPYMGGYKNKIINGTFAINQRAISGTVTLAAGAYGHDRWKAGSSGCTYTFATVENVTTITITAGSLLQIIEGLNLQSGTHILSWQGTAQGKIGAGSYGSSGITGTATGGTNLNIEFGTGTLKLVQFEQGSVATPFESRHIAQELALCQRYYCVPSPGYMAGQAISASEVVGQFVPFPVTMMAVPTVVHAALSVRTNLDSWATTTLGASSGITERGIRYTVNRSSADPNNSYVINAFCVADAEL